MRTTFDVMLGEPLKHNHHELDNHANWDSVYSTVQSNSAAWSSGSTSTSFSGVVGPSGSLVLNVLPVSSGWACDWRIGGITAGGMSVRNSEVACCWNALSSEIDENFTFIGSVDSLEYTTDVLSGVVRLIATNTGSETWTLRGRRGDL